MTDYRNQLLRAEAELESIRDQNTANKDVLKHRTKNMIEQVESLRSRYEACETRRKREAEGYQVNISFKIINNMPRVYFICINYRSAFFSTFFAKLKAC